MLQLVDGIARPIRWVGHSLGGRLALELAYRAPGRTAAVALLDPALGLDPAEAHAYAEEERAGREYASREEALAGRRDVAQLAPEAILEEELAEHLVATPDGRFRFRFAPSAVVAMYGELAGAPPAAPAGERLPHVLLVAGAESAFVTDDHVRLLRGSLGAALEVVTVPGGHIVLWDSFAESAGAIGRFLA